MGYVYLIHDSGNNYYKIGVTKTSIKKRMKKLQTGNPTELTLCSYVETTYPYRLENMLHIYFKSKNILNEWFALDELDIHNFHVTCKQMLSVIESLKDNPFFSKNLH